MIGNIYGSIVWKQMYADSHACINFGMATLRRQCALKLEINAWDVQSSMYVYDSKC